VSSRTGALALGTHVDPAALAAHVTTVLRDFAAAGHVYPPPAPEWLAAGCRWNLIMAALADRVRTAGPGAPPHPETDAWAGHYGRPVPGSTSGEQLAAVRGRKEAAWARLTSAERRMLVFGARDPSAIEKAVGARAGTPQWRPQLTATMTAAFADGTWALSWLAARRPRPAGRNR
jgi:hypothetical protein